MIDCFYNVLWEIEQDNRLDNAVQLTPKQLADLGPSYDTAIYYRNEPRITTGALNKGQDVDEIEREYFSSAISVTTIDNFLTPEALRKLQRFCLDSTIYFRCTGNNFVYSKIDSGFNSDILYQIAEELRLYFPNILGEHQLSNMWVYRYNNQSEGVAAHTDEAAVTFNLWITPSSSNSDPSSGGLKFYTKEQPRDWDWDFYNKNKYTSDVKKEINNFLFDAETLSIPYRENRALLFHSNLFHKSEQVLFKNGFEHRRMNVTFLFGKLARSDSTSLRFDDGGHSLGLTGC